MKNSAAWRWRRSYVLVGLRGRTAPEHVTGSAQLYGTGASVSPVDEWQREHVYADAPRDASYRCDVVFKKGHLTLEATWSDYAKTVDEGKEKCEVQLRRFTGQAIRRAQ